MTSLTEAAQLMAKETKLNPTAVPQWRTNRGKPEEVAYTLTLRGEWWQLSISQLKKLANEDQRSEARAVFGVPPGHQTEIDQRQSVRGIWYIVRFRWKATTTAEQQSFAPASPVEEGVTSYHEGA